VIYLFGSLGLKPKRWAIFCRPRGPGLECYEFWLNSC